MWTVGHASHKAIKVTLIIISVVLGILGVGAIYAQTSGDNNIIYAAYQKINGQLRIISDPSEVRNSEKLISWNVEGPAGPQGPQGEMGPEGPQGPQGEPGSAADVEELRDYIHELQARLDALEGSAMELPTLSVDDVTIVEGDNEGPILFRVYLSKPYDQDVNFYYETIDGSAIQGYDFIWIANWDLIPAGALSVQIEVTVIGDIFAEPDETFSLAILDSSVPVADGTGVATIIDDDAESGLAADVEELRDTIIQLDTQITLIQARLDALEGSAMELPTLYVDDVSVVEGNLGGPIPIRVYLSKPHDQEVTFWYETREGSAIGLESYPGTGEEDFIQTWGWVHIPIGALSVQIDARIIGDTRLESDETFFLELSLSTVPISDGTGIVTIIDDDAPGEKWDLTRIVQLQSGFSVWEGTGDTPTEIKLAVNLESPDPEPYPETVTVSWDLMATGTAIEGEDFTIPTPKILVFDPGETHKEIVVRITADAVKEVVMAKTILIQIKEVTNAYPSTYSTCIVTIFDDD